MGYTNQNSDFKKLENKLIIIIINCLFFTLLHLQVDADAAINMVSFAYFHKVSCPCLIVWLDCEWSLLSTGLASRA
jgi:hypothetical protein